MATIELCPFCFEIQCECEDLNTVEKMQVMTATMEKLRSELAQANQNVREFEAMLNTVQDLHRQDVFRIEAEVALQQTPEAFDHQPRADQQQYCKRHLRYYQ